VPFLFFARWFSPRSFVVFTQSQNLNEPSSSTRGSLFGMGVI